MLTSQNMFQQQPLPQLQHIDPNSWVHVELTDGTSRYVTFQKYIEMTNGFQNGPVPTPQQPGQRFNVPTQIQQQLPSQTTFQSTPQPVPSPAIQPVALTKSGIMSTNVTLTTNTQPVFSDSKSNSDRASETRIAEAMTARRVALNTATLPTLPATLSQNLSICPTIVDRMQLSLRSFGNDSNSLDYNQDDISQRSDMDSPVPSCSGYQRRSSSSQELDLTCADSLKKSLMTSSRNSVCDQQNYSSDVDDSRSEIDNESVRTNERDDSMADDSQMSEESGISQIKRRFEFLTRSSTSSHNAKWISRMSNDVKEADGVNLEELRTFAHKFIVFRAKYKLPQIKVSELLSNMSCCTGESANSKTVFYSQSAICRFEKLEVTPKSAQRTMKVLKAFKEQYKNNKAIGQDGTISLEAKERKKRTTYSKEEDHFLMDYFIHRSTKPSSSEIESISEKLNRTKQEITVWFNNRRQKNKVEQFSKSLQVKSVDKQCEPGFKGIFNRNENDDNRES